MKLVSRNADVVVAGGGVIGTAIAYFLAKNGVKTILVEKKGIASGSSGACDGAVLMQSKKPGIHLEMAMKSHKLLRDLQEQLPLSFELERNGGLIVIETEEEYSVMERHVEAQHKAGLPSELIDAKQLRDLSPQLSHHLLGASYLPTEGKVNPMSLTFAFAQGAVEAGAEILSDNKLLEVKKEGNKIVAVVTDKQEIRTNVLVNALGGDAPTLGAMVGVDIPIKPRRGQILVTETLPSLLKPCLLTASYIMAKHRKSSVGETICGGLSMDQTYHGNILLGSTRELVGYDKRNTVTGMQQIASRAIRVLPQLGKMRMVRAFSGLRPYTPDGLPILGEVDGVEGLIMAAGHEGDGIALSAITGELVSQLIVSGNKDGVLDDFNLRRFH